MAEAYRKLKSRGFVVKQVQIAALDELTVDGMSQIQRVVCEYTIWVALHQNKSLTAQ